MSCVRRSGLSVMLISVRSRVGAFVGGDLGYPVGVWIVCGYFCCCPLGLSCRAISGSCVVLCGCGDTGYTVGLFGLHDMLGSVYIVFRSGTGIRSNFWMCVTSGNSQSWFVIYCGMTIWSCLRSYVVPESCQSI